MTDTRRLDELGERAIIEEILRPRYGTGVTYFGNDCALIARSTTVANGLLVATTDPCPEPMASLLGFPDLYYRGWLLATINLSDLAAAGAQPLGLLTSLVLTNHTTVNQFVRLLDGIDECCRECGTQVLGGNLKEGPRIDVSGTAIGLCEENKILARTGCHEGDLIIVIGDLGSFWCGVLALRGKLRLDQNLNNSVLKNVLTPLPKVRLAQALAADNLLTSCIDNSDGLYPSLVQIANVNLIQIRVNMDSVDFSTEVSRVSSELKVDRVRLALGWGDWQLVASCRPSDLEAIKELARVHATAVHVIGQALVGRGVVLEHEGEVGYMAPIDSQRFTKDSWFTAGVDEYINRLTTGELWTQE